MTHHEVRFRVLLRAHLTCAAELLSDVLGQKLGDGNFASRFVLSLDIIPKGGFRE